MGYTLSKTLQFYPSGDGQPLSNTYQLVGNGRINLNVALPAASVLVSQPVSFGAPGTLAGSLVAVMLQTTQPLTIQSNGNGAIGVQTVTIGGTPTGGTFVLGYQGQVTAPIAYNAAASAVQTALRALSTIGGTNVTCTGGPFPGAAVTCTFSGTEVLQTVPLMTSSIAGLTGGAPTIAIANGSGSPQDVIQLAAGQALEWDAVCGLACPFLGAVTGFYLSCANFATFKGFILTV